MLINFDSNKLIRPPQEVTSFVDNMVKRLIEKGLYYEGPDRRLEKRHVVALQVRVVPLDAHLRPVGKAFTSTTKDISRGGIAIIHSQNIGCPLLGVELTDVDGFTFQAVVETLRSHRVGPYFEIGGKFVTKVYQAPETDGAH